MPAAARQGDGVTTGHPCDVTTTLNSPGQSTVFADGIRICCLGDQTVVHEILVGEACIPHTAAIVGSSTTVYIEGSLASRVGDSCDAGSISSGSSTVFIG